MKTVIGLIGFLFIIIPAWVFTFTFGAIASLALIGLDALESAGNALMDWAFKEQ